MSHPTPIDFGRTTLRFDGPAHIMGIINCTPDSFSDGGAHLDKVKAVEAGLLMVEQGASILDVGGESTRPGAWPVGLQEELDRVVPVIEALRRRSEVLISVDTMKAAVAEAALAAGADMVNDVTGMTGDASMARVVARSGAAAVLMHMRGDPRTMQRDTDYGGDLVEVIADGLDALVERAVEAGVARERLIVDPGIGFGKDGEGNLRLIGSAGRFGRGGLAVLIGPSRKSFIGQVLGIADPAERDWGTAAACAAAVMSGAHVLRVHAVGPMVQVARMAHAIMRARG